MHLENNSEQLTKLGSRKAKDSSELKAPENVKGFWKHFLFIFKPPVLHQKIAKIQE